MRKRTHGEGTIYPRIVTRRDGSTYKRWAGQLTVGHNADGTLKRVTVYGVSKGEVLAKLELLKRDIADGALPDERRTVAAYLDEWLEMKRQQVKPRTHTLYRLVIEQHIDPRIGHLRLTHLRPLDVQRMITRIANEVGVSTANKARRTLFGALKQAVRWQLLTRNVVEAVDPLRETPKSMTLWTPEEAVRFLDTARAHRLYPAFHLLMVTGLRRGEVLGLWWSDLRDGALWIQRSYTSNEGKNVISEPKTERGMRWVTLPPDALVELEQHRERQHAERAILGSSQPKSEWMFTLEDGRPVTPVAFQHHWTKLQALAGVPRARLHDLRHLHVSLLVRHGFDPRTIADRVGHTDPAFTLRRYSHMFEEQRRAAAVGLEELLGVEKGEGVN